MRFLVHCNRIKTRQEASTGESFEQRLQFKVRSLYHIQNSIKLNRLTFEKIVCFSITNYLEDIHKDKGEGT